MENSKDNILRPDFAKNQNQKQKMNADAGISAFFLGIVKGKKPSEIRKEMEEDVLAAGHDGEERLQNLSRSLRKGHGCRGVGVRIS